jgi:hypothetical protein
LQLAVSCRRGGASSRVATTKKPAPQKTEMPTPYATAPSRKWWNEQRGVTGQPAEISCRRERFRPSDLGLRKRAGPAKLARACRTLLATVRLECPWTEHGPTPERAELLEANGGPLSFGERVMLLGAWALTVREGSRSPTSSSDSTSGRPRPCASSSSHPNTTPMPWTTGSQSTHRPRGHHDLGTWTGVSEVSK